MAEKAVIGTDVNQFEITSLNHIRGQKKVTDLLKVNLDAYFQSRQTGNTTTFGPVLLCDFLNYNGFPEFVKVD